MDYGSVALLYDFHPNQTMREDVEFYLEEGRRAAGPILELGCGSGRILAPLAAAGLDVTGLDNSAGMLERCRTALAGHQAMLVEADMRNFELGRHFALITAPFRAFQHLLTVPDQLACLAAVRRHLAPGGRFLLDLFNPWLEFLIDENRARWQQDGPIYNLPDGSEVTRSVRRASLDVFSQVQEIEMLYQVVGPDGGRREFPHHFSIRHLFRYEAEHLLARAGLEVLELYADFDRSPYGSVRPGDLLFIAGAAPPTDWAGA